jgi:hypothetical protein
MAEAAAAAFRQTNCEAIDKPHRSLFRAVLMTGIGRRVFAFEEPNHTQNDQGNDNHHFQERIKIDHLNIS